MFRQRSLTVFLLVFLGVLFFCFPGWSTEKRLEIRFLPVQEGEATLIRTPQGKNILMDGGGIGDGFRIVQNLMGLGVKEIDLVIATHPHSQNIGGLLKVLEDLPVKEVLDSGFPYQSQVTNKYLQLIETKKIPLSFARAGQIIKFDSGIYMHIIAPPAYPLDEADQSSVVCQLVYGKQSFLFTGDATGPYLGKVKSPVTVLKVPKRGETESVDKNLLNILQPQEAIIFQAKGEGSAKTLQALKDCGAKTRLVNSSGGVTILSDGKEYEIVPTVQEKSIVISLSQHTLSLYWNGEIYRKYKVAVGKSSTPTPKGKFKIVNKSINPGGPFGVRWLGFHPSLWPSYGIHGTNVPSSIGKSASHGCIRMYNQDVTELYNLVKIGTPVTVVP